MITWRTAQSKWRNIEIYGQVLDWMNAHKKWTIYCVAFADEYRECFHGALSVHRLPYIGSLHQGVVFS